MSLEVFLKERNNTHGKSAEATVPANESKVVEGFHQQSASIFNKQVEPLLNRVVQLFKANGCNAQKAQWIEQGGYAFGANAVSLSVEYNNQPYQWDIYSDELATRITVRFIHSGGSAIDRHFSFEMFDQATLEELIYRDLKDAQDKTIPLAAI